MKIYYISYKVNNGVVNLGFVDRESMLETMFELSKNKNNTTKEV